MLEIKTNGENIDIGAETSISLTMENPLMAADNIPVTYTLNFELPRTPHNLELFGHPERITTKGISTKLQSQILFAGFIVATGILSIEEVQETITVQFIGAETPDGIRKPLYKLDFGGLELGTYFPNGSGSRLDLYGFGGAGHYYNEFLTGNLWNPDADIIAAPISIGDAEWIPLEEIPRRPGFWHQFDEIELLENPGDPYVNQRLHYINAYMYNASYHSYGYIQDEFESGQMSKILPSFRVGWMFDKIFNGRCGSDNVFNNEWKQLMLVSLWHPRYQTVDKAGVWDIVDGKITVRYANFMPDVPANEFVAEMLKIAGASLYMNGDRCTIEKNEDILNRQIFKDWSNKLMGTPTISIEPAGKYTFGYSSGDDGEVPVERVLEQVNSVFHMRDMCERPESEMKTFYIPRTGQTFENLLEEVTVNRCSYSLLKQDLYTKSEDEDYEDEDKNEIDMSTNVAVLKTVPARYIGKDNDPMENTAENRRFYYVPQIGEAPEERPDNLTVALWKGMAQTSGGIYYPYLSHCNYNITGGKLDDVTLQLTGATLDQHTLFKAWVEKDKRVLKADINLTPSDLNQLDLRDKFYIRGLYFYIRSLEITLTPTRMEAAEVQFIEV